jgi:hypothetical protein
MLKQKNAASVLAHRRGKNREETYYMNIVSLKRAAVKLAITADLVLLLAALGSLNIPVTVLALLALNLLCGLYFKEESSHEKI